MKIVTSIILIYWLFIPSFLSISYAQSVPSCLDVIEGRTSPGAAPDCAPMIIPNDIAFSALKELSVNKFGPNRFIVIPKIEVPELSRAGRWQMLVLAACSLQSLYGENSDIYIIEEPQTEEDKLALMFGRYSEKKTLAIAIYVTQRFGASYNWPPDHHERLYRLIVY